MQLGDGHLDIFHEQGYVCVEDFYPEEKRAEIAAEVRKQLPTWEEIKDVEPDRARGDADFPYEEMFFNHLGIVPILVETAQAPLATVGTGSFFRKTSYQVTERRNRSVPLAGWGGGGMVAG